MNVTTDQEREAKMRADFEAFWLTRSAPRPDDFAELGDGTYAQDHVQRHWWTWQAATARQASELEALRADAKRIDWLADQFKTCTVYMSGQHPWAPNSYKLRQLAGPTFRAAIDAAKGQA